MSTGIVHGAVWFSAFVFAHVLWFHFSPPAGRFKAIAVLFLCTLAASIVTASVCSVATTAEDPDQMWIAVRNAIVATTTMGCLFVLYMPFYFVVATSLSIQTVNLLRRSPDGSLEVERLRNTFASDSIVADRMQTMAANGYLVVANQTFRLSAKGASVAYVFRFLKRLWRLGPGG